MMKTMKFTTIKRQLMLLLLTALLPMFLFSVCVVGYVAFQHQTALDTSLTSTTRALSDSISSELKSIESNLNFLIAVEDFTDLELLHRRLKRFVDNQNEWSSIGVTGIDGKQFFNTLKPYGTALPNFIDQPFFREALATKKSIVSGFKIGRISGRKNFSVAVPVIKNGNVQYILIATVNVGFLADTLKRQKLPENWTATVLDNDGIIMARNVFHEKFVGERASDALLKTISQGEHFFETLNKEGKKQYGTFTNLSNGWRVYLGVPYHYIQLPSGKILMILIIGGLTLLIIGIFLSVSLSRKISSPIIGLAESAKLIGKGGKALKIETDVFEVNEVAVALENASVERDLADEKAMQAIQLRDNFLSVASHELKTPLTTINLQAQRLVKLTKDFTQVTPENLTRSSSSIMNQVKRLTRLIDELLDISRITAGKLDVNKEKFDLAHLTREVVSHFEGIHSSTIILNHAPVEGHFDRNRMEQVITNLISNAIKYGGGKPIEVSLSAENGKANIHVKDLGIGIEKKDHGKIFERFERLVSNKEISGLGLGLWIVHRIVTQLEGEVHVASEGAGKGSIFTVSIPLE
jgi:signal transduction histidine kinase